MWFYHQRKGTAMGTKVTSTCTTLVLGCLEETLYDETENSYGKKTIFFIQDNILRFLDKYFIIQPHNKCIYQFVNLNSLNPSISYILKVSEPSLPFLDVLVIR